MEGIIFLLSPFFVNVVTQVLKKIRTIELSEYRKSLIRLLSLVASFVAIVTASLLSGEDVPVADVQTLVEGVLLFAVTQIAYHIDKYKVLK